LKRLEEERRRQKEE